MVAARNRLFLRNWAVTRKSRPARRRWQAHARTAPGPALAQGDSCYLLLGRCSPFNLAPAISRPVFSSATTTSVFEVPNSPASRSIASLSAAGIFTFMSLVALTGRRFRSTIRNPDRKGCPKLACVRDKVASYSFILRSLACTNGRAAEHTQDRRRHRPNISDTLRFAARFVSNLFGFGYAGSGESRHVA
jgi:hypothetical protein